MLGNKIKKLIYLLYVKTEKIFFSNKKRIEKKIKNFNYKPLLSIITPVYKIEPELLKAAIDSVINQYYQNWELCIVDDASEDKEIIKVLNYYKGIDSRIKIKILSKNQGMSGASNEALALAKGEFITFLDHDDEYNKNCLYEVVNLLNKKPDADIIYSNEDKLTLDGRRLNPVIKPPWTPELFLTYNYITHLTVCRKTIIDKISGFRKGFEGSQDYDLLLRATELTDKIYHIPKILYHWRMIPGSAAEVVDAKSYAFERSKEALRDAMLRRGIKATVTDGEQIGHFKVIRE